MPAMVELERVSKKYKWFTALTEVSFSLQEGEVFGYCGPNGAGKTTTLKILAGLIARFEGSVRIAGKAVHALAGRRGDDSLHELIGYLPQSTGFQSWQTPDSALRMLGRLSGVSEADLDRRIPAWLERFSLADVRHKRIRKLSGGMVQKVGLIQALLHQPRLVILDEPLSGLDPVTRRIVKEVVREHRKAGATVIFSSHILSDVQDIADRVGIIDRGRMVTVGTLAELESHFELPVDIAVEFAAAPRSDAFLRTSDSVLSAEERRQNSWVVRLAEGADADAAVHHLIEQTIAHGGRLRRIGAMPPNLDELYARFTSATVPPQPTVASRSTGASQSNGANP